MKEIDAMLVHGYTDFEGYRGIFDDRNFMQSHAAPQLVRSGRVENIILASGHYWGKNKPPLAEQMADRLEKSGVEPEKIIILPETTTTSAEIDVFLHEANLQGWKNLASLSNKTHTPRIKFNYFKKGRPEVENIITERVLYSIIDETGNKPYLDFLKEFRKRERKFIAREALAITFDLYGLQPLGQRFSDSRVGQVIKSVIDG